MEILDPETLQPVPEGNLGEMVVTTLRKEGAPLVRYRTRDLTRFIPGRCACGSLMPRHDRLMGRSDDMFIFRAVNIYPGQIESVVCGAEGVCSEYQIVLDRKDGKDFMTVNVERAPEAGPERDQALEAEIGRQIKNQIMVSSEVRVVDYGTLPRSERKSKRVYDNRAECATA
jgi:phenylacetate-CoA ligase